MIDGEKLARVEREIVEAADRLGVEFQAEFDALPKDGTADRRMWQLGYMTSTGNLGPDGGMFPSAPAKYFFIARRLVRSFAGMLPLFDGVRSTFEIGPGPGFLMVLLRDVLGQRVSGIDVEVEDMLPYRALREAYGLTPFVTEHRVEAHEAVPIPPGTEQLACLGTVFNRGWDVRAHEAFVAECRSKLVGPKRIVWRFNKVGLTDRPDVNDYYRSIGATMRVNGDKRLMVLPLAETAST